ncbi:conserved hypothetical protein [Vibrio aestuarianus]|nr:conserved hypothetical protein [Vibrio aestuarianus]
MTWLKALPIFGKLLLKVAGIWERQDRAKKVQQQERKYEAIKDDAKASHSQRFGASSGSVQLSAKRDSKPD